MAFREQLSVDPVSARLDTLYSIVDSAQVLVMRSGNVPVVGVTGQ